MNPKIFKALNLLMVWGVLIISLANDCYGQWGKKCPRGGVVNCFVKRGNEVFAGTLGGVYKSADNGATWTLSNNGINVIDIRCMLVTGSKIFAGSGGGIYSSSDGGANWILCGLPNDRVYAMVQSQSTIFATSRNGGIYKSNDLGLTWSYAGLSTQDIRALHLAGNNIVAGAAGFDALYYSADNGISWQQSTSPYSNVVGFATSGTDVFAASTEGIIKSSDNGLTWMLTSNGLQNSPTEAISANGGNLYAGSYGQGIFYSNNNGANWTRLNNGISNLYVLGIFADASKVFAGTFGGGIYTSTNNGINWSKANSGYCGQAIVDFGSTGSSLFAATPNGVYKSIDQGETWTESNNGLANSLGNIHNVFSLASSGNTIYAGTEKMGAYKSTDNGATWTAINNGLLRGGVQDVISMKASGSTIFAGTYGWGIFRSTDGGNNWVQTITGLAHQVVESIAFLGNDVYCSQWNGISKSTDNGNTWVSVNLTAGVYQLAVSGNTVFAGGSGSIGVIKSSDGGQTWVAANNGLTDLNIISLVANQNIIVAGTNSGVFISTNNGLTWTPINDGFESPIPKIQSLIINNDDLIAGSLYQSVWKKNACIPASITTQPQDFSACSGTNASVSVSATGTSLSYQWSKSTDGGSNFINISGANSSTYSFVATSTDDGNIYRVSVTEASCGSLVSSSALLNVNLSPVVTITASPSNVLLPGQTIQLNASSNPGSNSFNWFKNGNRITGQNGSSISITANGAGTYTASVTDANNCTGTSNSIVIRDSVPSNSFIYPNPNRGEFKVTVPSSIANSNLNITLYDSKGSRVYIKTYAFTVGAVLEVNVKTLSSGIYAVVLSDKDGNIIRTGKVLID